MIYDSLGASYLFVSVDIDKKAKKPFYFRILPIIAFHLNDTQIHKWRFQMQRDPTITLHTETLNSITV